MHKAKENARSTASQMRVKLGKIVNIQDLLVDVKNLQGLKVIFKEYYIHTGRSKTIRNFSLLATAVVAIS